MDIVIPVVPSSVDDNEELKIALRSIATHAINKGTVWLVGNNTPAWATNVHVLHIDDPFTNNKDANIIRKVIRACADPRVSDNFMFWSDDQVLLKGTDISKQIPVFNPRGLPQFYAAQSKNRWTSRMINTLELVGRHGGCQSINWDSHVPQPINKLKFMEAMEHMPYSSCPGVCINTAYFGYIKEKPIMHQDTVKQTFEDIIKGPINLTKPYIGYNDKGYKSGLREVLLNTFNEPCMYEK